MKNRIVALLLVATLGLTTMLTGCGGKDKDVERKPYVSTVTDLDSIEIGPFKWPVHKGYDYSKPYNKRFDGLEFTYCASSTGSDLKEPYTPEENPETWRLQGVTGLKAKVLWTAAGSAYSQKLGQAITSGDIPDVMTVSLAQYRQLVKAGLIADLTDELLEGDHPTIQAMWAAKDNIALESLKIDGRIYGIPGVGADYDGTSMVWIRKDWLDKLNIEGPKSWKDLERVAKAFMEQDPDGNGKADTMGIPITSTYGGRGEGSLSELFVNVGGANPDKWMKNEDGTISFGSLHKGAKKALTLLNDWYKKGIIEEDFATWDTAAIEQVVTNDQAGIVLSPWFAAAHSLYNSIALNPNAEWEAYMLPGEEGEPVYGNEGDYLLSITVVSKKFSHPEAFVYAMDMLEANGNQYNTEAEDPTFSYGGMEGYIAVSGSYKPVGGPVPNNYYTEPISVVYDNVEKLEDLTTYESVDAIRTYLTEKGTGKANMTRVKDTTFLNLPILLAELKKESPRQVVIQDKYGNDMNLIAGYQQYLLYWQGPEAIVKANPIGVHDEFLGTTEATTLYMNFLTSHIQECYTKMIMGKTDGKSISKYFDQMVKDWDKQGGKEVDKEVNEAYKEIWGK